MREHQVQLASPGLRTDWANRRIVLGAALARLGHGMLAVARKVPGWASMVRSIDQAAGRGRHRQLEAELASANAEIERLRAALEAATQPPTQFAQMRARKMAIGRLARLWIARDGDRQA